MKQDWQLFTHAHTQMKHSWAEPHHQPIGKYGWVCGNEFCTNWHIPSIDGSIIGHCVSTIDDFVTQMSTETLIFLFVVSMPDNAT